MWAPADWRRYGWDSEICKRDAFAPVRGGDGTRVALSFLEEEGVVCEEAGVAKRGVGGKMSET